MLKLLKEMFFRFIVFNPCLGKFCSGTYDLGNNLSWPLTKADTETGGAEIPLLLRVI